MDTTIQTSGRGYSSTKRFSNLPCSHRAWAHDGHCHHIHGYSREFTFHFACNKLTKEGFVVDFSALKELRKWLEYMFDHTMLINEDDPEIELFKELHLKDIIQLRVLPNCSMEGTAKFVYDWANDWLSTNHNLAWCYKVEVRENDKNSASYKVREG